MGSRRPSSDQVPELAPAFPPGWLGSFLVWLPLTAGAMAAGLWCYALWGFLAVERPARMALERGDDAGIIEAVGHMETSHIFAGYEPYHGFGPKSAAPTFEDVRTVVGRGTSYSPAETAWLVRNIAYFVPAFLELKGEGKVSIVSGDRKLAEGLLDRWENALFSNVALATHLTLVALLLGLVWFLYRKYNLYEKLGK